MRDENIKKAGHLSCPAFFMLYENVSKILVKG